MAAEKAAGSVLSNSFSRALSGALGDVANRLQAYLDRNEDSAQLRHRAGVPVGKFAWYGFRYFADPIEDLQLELESELGFDWLTADDFDGDVDAEACWQRPFTFAEVEAGYALDRERPGRDGEERENVTDGLFDQLQDGGQRVVLGRPGSGKTTICKSVAVRWYESDDTGPVLYRKSGQGVADGEMKFFHHAIERAKARGPVLVVVEDAARRETVGFLETVKEYAGDFDVSFLLDSRVNEWRSGGETFREEVDVGLQDAMGKSVQSLVGGEIEQRRVPPLDEREVERVVERFTEKTGKPVQESPEEILERIRTREAGEDGPVRPGTEGGTWSSPMLLLVYHLQRGDYAVDPEAMDEDGPKSALRTNVEEAYEAVEDSVTSDHELMPRGRDDLRERVGVLINVLNASGIGVRRELVHSLAESHSDHDTIDGFLANMEGILHFGVDEGTRYHAPHPLWSTLYLVVLLERKESEAQAREVFEDAVNALFSFVDDAERREEFREWSGRDVGLLSAIEEHPTEVADEIVSTVFDISIERPKLVTLYGTTEYSGLALPDSCSDETWASCALWRSQMYRIRGDREEAINELKTFREKGSRADVDSDRIDAVFFSMRGIIARVRGDLELARKYSQQSLDIDRELGNRAGEAKSLDNLGVVAKSLGNYEQAREYHEQSIKIFQEVGNRQGAATNLLNLGTVAFEKGDFNAAREYCIRSLNIFRNVGDSAGEAKSLGNLGLVAQSLGNYEQAREYHERSLEMSREVGDRTEEATNLNNLGAIAIKKSDFGAAYDYFKRSLKISREVGDSASEAKNLDNLGLVAQSLANYERAREYHEQSIEIFREVDDRSGEASSLNNLGNLAFEQEDFESAQDYYEQAANILHDIEAMPRCLTSYDNLVQNAIQMNNPERGIDYAETALAIIDQTEVSGLKEQRRTFESHLDRLETADQD